MQLRADELTHQQPTEAGSEDEGDRPLTISAGTCLTKPPQQIITGTTQREVSF